MIAFALLGLFTSLAPRFLAETLGYSSKALAGVVCFAGYAAAASAQILAGSQAVGRLLRLAAPAVCAGPWLLVIALWDPDAGLPLFLAGAVITGAGCGLLFKGAIASASATAREGKRAEVFAGMFVAAYLGLTVPIVGLGALTEFVSVRLSLLIFVAVLAGGMSLAAPRLLRASAVPVPGPEGPRAEPGRA
jgi:hypothetical protein